MDPLEVLPPEVVLRVLEYLEPADLCRCLGVSSHWRQLASTDKLWRTFCHRKQLVPNNATAGLGPLPLSPWASTYIGYMRRLVGNWKSGSFESYQLVKEDWCCCIACWKSLLAVYYPRTAQVYLYLLDSGVVPLSSLPVALPGGTSIPDVFVSEEHLVLSLGNSVLVYWYGGGLRKCLIGVDGGLLVSDVPLDPLEVGASDRRLYVKIVSGDVVWLESDMVFVVDMENHTYRSLGDTFRCLRWDGKRVFAANDAVTVFNITGDLLFQLDIRRVTDMWVSGDYLVVLIGYDVQHLEVWGISKRSKLRSLDAEKDPTICLSQGSMYLLEFGENLLRLSCVSLETGVVCWSYVNSFERELLIHPEVRLICDRFLFVRPSHTRDGNFLLVDSKTGSVLYDSVMPPCLAPPCYIYHLSDEVFITAESGKIHIRSYT